MEDSIQYREEEEEEEAESKERPDWRQQREEIWKQEMYNPHRIGWYSDLKTGTEFTNQIEYIKIFGSSKKRSERQMKTQPRKGREEEKSALEITSSPNLLTFVNGHLPCGGWKFKAKQVTDLPIYLDLSHDLKYGWSKRPELQWKLPWENNTQNYWSQVVVSGSLDS